MSVVQSQQVDLASPAGIGGAVAVKDVDGNDKLASPVVLVDLNGDIVPQASETTLQALKAVADNLLLASQAIETATEALNTKAVALNTGAIAGTVAISNFPAGVDVVSVDNFPSTQTIAGQVSLDAPTLTALETINATTGGLTNTELRASPILANNSQYDTIIDEPNATTIYICEALIGTASSAALWRVQRITTAGTVKTIRFAGTGAFDQVADNRASLSYA